MPQYAWDSAAARNASKQLRSEAETMRSTLSSCKTDVDSDLSSWSGDASVNMTNSNDIAYNKIDDDINVQENMASYLDEISSKVDALESDLAAAAQNL